ncbi:MAG: DedA family protein [Anaerolineae bacterium]|nr:DedA family protein [Anaerolineae bacterium]
MSLTDLNDLFLTWMIIYGSPMLAGVLFLGALGIPVPGTLIVIAAGAFVRQGVLDFYTTPPFGLSGAVAGDVIIYGLGRFARVWIQRRFGQSAAWQKAEDFFNRRGGIAIYLTRWLLTPLALPTNLIAGSSGYGFWKFLFYDLAGELTWIVLYGGLGYAFGSQWELISDFISDFSGLLLGLVVLGVGLYLILRRREQTAVETSLESAL